MENPLTFYHHDLVTPDGRLTSVTSISPQESTATLLIEGIAKKFVGFHLEQKYIIFNLKSTLAQLGLHGIYTECQFNPARGTAEVQLTLSALDKRGEALLALLQEGMYIGKLFAAAPERRVRTPEYLTRMFNRKDRNGDSLLAFTLDEDDDESKLFQVVDGRAVAFLPPLPGRITFSSPIDGALPLLAQALLHNLPVRNLLPLYQHYDPEASHEVAPGELLLLRTDPLHIRTVFAHVVDELLPPGLQHTSASVLQPDTKASGDIYEFFGTNHETITHIPLEFYTLEPYHEYVFFEDRDQLQSCLESPSVLFEAFKTAPQDALPCATYVVKGSQLLSLKESDWVMRSPQKKEFPGLTHSAQQQERVAEYIVQQPIYPFLKGIEDNVITSHGILLTRYFPSPLTKRMLLAPQVLRNLKGIYFRRPSQTTQEYFSHEDHALLMDLATSAVPVYWVDKASNKILAYTQRKDKECGMFVPVGQEETFRNSVMFGVYGSNLLQGSFEHQLVELFSGLKELQQESDHHLFNPHIPISLVTGGGPGAMAVGNRVAQQQNILSCANIVDFRTHEDAVVNEQLINPHIEAKMTYRLSQIVERQADFQLDFPIFVVGGMGTDFELALEEVRRKVGAVLPTPVLLFGDPTYWRKKITDRFHCNQKAGTIKGSEWVSNCFYCTQNVKEALAVYRHFFNNSLPIGPEGPVYSDGFCTVATWEL